MKRRTLQRKWLIPLFFLLIGSVFESYAQSEDCLYVYASTGTERTFRLDDIQKITFTEQNMLVIPTGGSTASILYDDIAYLTFAKKTGISELTESNDQKVIFNMVDDRLIVENTSEITSISLYNMQGTLLQRISPHSYSADMSLSGCPAGVYVLQITNGQNVSVHKILKR